MADPIEQTHAARPLGKVTRSTEAVLAALLAAPEQEAYGMELVAGTRLQSSTVYPILRRLEAHDWVTSRWVDPRPQRRYYQLTPSGAARARALFTRPKRSRRPSLTRLDSTNPKELTHDAHR